MKKNNKRNPYKNIISIDIGNNKCELRYIRGCDCNVDESGNFQEPLKITSLKQIYLQIEKKIYTRPHSLSNALTHHSQTH